MTAKGEYFFAIPAVNANRSNTLSSFPVMIPKPADSSLAAQMFRNSPISGNGHATLPPRKTAKPQLHAPATPPPSPISAQRFSTTAFSIDSSESSSSQSRRKATTERIAKKRDRTSTVSSIFDKNAEHYRCCCGGRLHIRHGALIIGIVECVLALVNLITAVCLDAEFGQRAQPMRGVQTEAYLIISVFGLAFYVGTVGWMVYVSANRRKIKRSYLHLIPHMVIQLLTIMVLAGAVIILAVLAFHTKHVQVAVDVIVLALLSVGLGLEVFFFALVLRCYHYLKDEYELSCRAIPTCVVCPVSVATVQSVILYQPDYTYRDVKADEYCVY